ncbi:hypothetical protein D3C72_1325830 [compost metagenome]
MRGGHVFAQTAVGVVVEHGLRVLAEPEIAVERVEAAGSRVAGAAGAAAAAIAGRIHIHAIAGLEVMDLRADLLDDASRIEAEDGGQPGQGQVGKPFLPVAQHITQVRHDAARLDPDQDIGWPRLGHRDLLDHHRLANVMHARGAHHLRHACLHNVIGM